MNGNKRGSRSFSFLAVLIILTLPLLAACQPAVPIPETGGDVTFQASDFAYNLPDQISAGMVTLTMENTGEEPHHTQFMRLNENVTMEQFNEAMQGDPNAIFELGTFEGGPGMIPPGTSLTVTLDLQPGQYVALCFVESSDGLPHLAKGMVDAFQVVGEAAGSAEPIEADLEIIAKDFMFDMPSTVPSGSQIWAVINEGPQPHELALVKLAEGMTMDDVEAYFQSPEGAPPFLPAGGMQALSTGMTGWVYLDLEPGDYAVLCFVPDPTTGQPHIALGMIMPLTVE